MKKEEKRSKNIVACWCPHVKLKHIDKHDWKIYIYHVAWLIATCQFSFLKITIMSFFNCYVNLKKNGKMKNVW